MYFSSAVLKICLESNPFRRIATGFIWLFVGTLLGTLGCGIGAPKADYGSLKLVEVAGTVRFEGSPLANAQIRFEDKDGTCSEAITDSQGKYRLMFDSRTYGTTPGSKVVRIEVGTQASLSSGEDDPDVVASPSINPTIRIPASYNKSSVLNRLITVSANNVDFDLNSQGTDPAGPR